MRDDAYEVTVKFLFSFSFFANASAHLTVSVAARFNILYASRVRTRENATVVAAGAKCITLIITSKGRKRAFNYDGIF